MYKSNSGFVPTKTVFVFDISISLCESSCILIRYYSYTHRYVWRK